MRAADRGGSRRTSSVDQPRRRDVRRPETLDLALDHRALDDAGRIAPRRKARDERLEALEALRMEAAQFGVRLGMVVDANVERRVILGRDDQERDRLLAALVSAR